MACLTTLLPNELFKYVPDPNNEAMGERSFNEDIKQWNRDLKTYYTWQQSFLTEWSINVCPKITAIEENIQDIGIVADNIDKLDNLYLEPKVKNFLITDGNKIVLDFIPFGDIEIIIKRKNGVFYEDFMEFLSSEDNVIVQDKNITLAMNFDSKFIAKVRYFTKDRE